ncbi:hypothetical protein PMAYCL1PPCAC_10786, partial [Pristionchus mayeri]
QMQQHQLQHGNHYLEEPDLDVSSIVTEFVPLEDPFVPYFDATEETEAELCAPLEASFASSCGAAVEERMYARFRPQPTGYPPNTSTPTPRFADSPPRVEEARAAGASAASPQRLEDAFADLMDGVEAGRQAGGRSPQQLVEASPGAAAAAAAAHNYREPPPQLSVLEQFLQSISRMVNDTQYARTTNCFKAKIPRDISESTLSSFLTHFVRFPMRRPANTLLQARTSPAVVKALLKTMMEPQSEEYDVSMTRESYFRITLKGSVHSLGQLYQMVRGVALSHRGFVDVNWSPVRGRIAFLGYNGSLPIRMMQPIGSYLEVEQEARQRLNAIFSADVTLSRCGDDSREVFINFFDNVETNPRNGQQSRVTEVNIYHVIHPASSSSTMMATMSSPTMTSSFSSTPTPLIPYPQLATPTHLAATPQHLRGVMGARCFPGSISPKCPEVPVYGQMVPLARMFDPMYTLDECFQLARSYPQHKW